MIPLIENSRGHKLLYEQKADGGYLTVGVWR